MDFKRAKPKPGEWWIIQWIEPRSGREIVYIDFVHTDHVTFGDGNSFNIDQMDFIRVVDLWEGEKRPLR